MKDIRIETIRATAIYLVILIHFCNYYLSPLEAVYTGNYLIALFYNISARISVPLFFMISGAVGLKKDFSFKKNKRKITHMLIVLVLWSIIYYLWNYFFLGRDMLSVNIFNFLFDPLKNHLWYMYAYIGLLIVQPFTALLAKHMKPVHENYFIIAWLLLCGGIKMADCLFDYMDITANLKYKIPIIQGTYYFGYYLCGHILYKRLTQKKQFDKYSKNIKASLSDSLLNLKTVYYLFTAAVSIIICFALTAYISVEITHTMEKPIFGYSSLLIMIPTLCMFIAFIKFTPPHGNFKICKKIIAAVGNPSFGIYLSHLIFFSILYTYADIRSLDSAYALPLLSVLILIVSHIFVEITKRIPFINKYLY